MWLSRTTPLIGFGASYSIRISPHHLTRCSGQHRVQVCNTEPPTKVSPTQLLLKLDTAAAAATCGRSSYTCQQPTDAAEHAAGGIMPLPCPTDI